MSIIALITFFFFFQYEFNVAGFGVVSFSKMRTFAKGWWEEGGPSSENMYEKEGKEEGVQKRAIFANVINGAYDFILS